LTRSVGAPGPDPCQGPQNCHASRPA
jgi:hypothetical protein